MASTVDLKNLTEYFDPEEELKSKIEELAGLFKAAKRVLFFTGAGISTSASIPDFRGPEGCWTNQALGKAPPKSISMIKAQPTECHMGIVACLQTKNSQPLGATIESTPASSSSPPSSSSSSSPSLSSSAALSPVWGRVVSQNIDGLHRRSGIAAKDISELHGNLFQEVCWGCQKSYLRTFEIKSGGRYAGGACPECTKRVPYFCHCTSRLCGACGGRLKDSIIHFKENLPAGEVTKAFRWADEADLCIVLGSSCTVSPACLVPKTVAKRGGHLVIVNLQKTPLDHLAKLRIFCKTDQFMRLFLAAAGVAPVAWDPAQDLVGEPCQVDDDEEDDVPVEDIDSFFSSSAVTQAIAASGLPSSTTTPSTTPSTTASGSDGQTDGSSFITAPFEDLTDDQDKGGYVDPIKDCPHATNLATAPTLEAARALVEGHCHDCEEAKERWVCLHCLQARCGRYKQAHAVSHQGAHPDHAVALSLEDLTTWCYQCSSYILSEDTESLQLSFYVAKFGALPDGCSSDMST